MPLAIAILMKGKTGIICLPFDYAWTALQPALISHRDVGETVRLIESAPEQILIITPKGHKVVGVSSNYGHIVRCYHRSGCTALHIKIWVNDEGTERSFLVGRISGRARTFIKYDNFISVTAYDGRKDDQTVFIEKEEVDGSVKGVLERSKRRCRYRRKVMQKMVLSDLLQKR